MAKISGYSLVLLPLSALCFSAVNSAPIGEQTRAGPTAILLVQDTLQQTPSGCENCYPNESMEWKPAPQCGTWSKTPNFKGGEYRCYNHCSLNRCERTCVWTGKCQKS